MEVESRNRDLNPSKNPNFAWKIKKRNYFVLKLSYRLELPLEFWNYDWKQGRISKNIKRAKMATLKDIESKPYNFTGHDLISFLTLFKLGCNLLEILSFNLNSLN